MIRRLDRPLLFDPRYLGVSEFDLRLRSSSDGTTLFSSPWIVARIHNRKNLMNYNELIRLYFERSTAMQQY